MFESFIQRVSYITVNIYCKLRNLTYVRDYSIDLRLFLRHPVYAVLRLRMMDPQHCLHVNDTVANVQMTSY